MQKYTYCSFLLCFLFMSFACMKNDNLISFGLRLRELRKSKGLTQLELSEKGGFDKNYISMLERGERNPALLNLIRLAYALEVQLGELINFKLI